MHSEFVVRTLGTRNNTTFFASTDSPSVDSISCEEYHGAFDVLINSKFSMRQARLIGEICGNCSFHLVKSTVRKRDLSKKF